MVLNPGDLLESRLTVAIYPVKEDIVLFSKDLTDSSTGMPGSSAGVNLSLRKVLGCFCYQNHEATMALLQVSRFLFQNDQALG